MQDATCTPAAAAIAEGDAVYGVLSDLNKRSRESEKTKVDTCRQRNTEILW